MLPLPWGTNLPARKALPIHVDEFFLKFGSDDDSE